MIQVAKVLALNSDNHSIQPLVSLNEAEFDLFVLVSAEIEDAFTKTRYALSEAETAFFASNEPISVRLPQVTEVIKSALSGATSIEILAVAIQRSESLEKALYLISFGLQLKALVIREGSQINLTELGGEGQLISGFFRSDDRLVLTNQTLLNILAEDTHAVIQESTLENFEEEVLSRLPHEQVLPVAAIVIEERSSENSSHQVAYSSSNPKSFQLGNITRFLPKLSSFVPKSRRGALILGVVLLLLAFGGVAAGYWQQRQTKESDEFSTKLQSANSQLERAKSLKDLDTAGAIQSLTEAEQLLGAALTMKPEDGQALELKRQIDLERGGILKTYQVRELNSWLSLDLIKKDFTSDFLSSSVGNLLILDRNSKSLVTVSQSSKSPTVLSGQDKLGEGELASLNGELAFVYSEDKGVLRVDSSNNTVTTVAKVDDEWGDIVTLYGFAGNVYLLDSNKNQIWKYLPIEKGYSEKRNYLRDDTKVDFSGAIRMQIDSSVWVLKSSGELLKFTQGVSDNFSYSGLDTPVKSPKGFYVSDETENLYLLDSGNKRMLVLTKTGAYKSQYQSEQMSEFIDLVVDEKGKKVYLLDGKKIYLLELQ